jgi:hypothetical protein
VLDSGPLGMTGHALLLPQIGLIPPPI